MATIMKNIHIPDDVIPREGLLNAVEPFMDQPLIKVFTGQRRAGKSYLLYQLMQKIRNRNPEAKFIYINKEDYAFDKIKTYEDLMAFIQGQTDPKKKYYLFIDEIQDITSFEKALRSLLLKGSFDIYISGSNANLLSGEFATLLGGRTMEFRVFSLSYGEFLTFHNLPDSEESLSLYMKYGGLPFLRNLKLTHEIVYEYLKNIYNSIVYRDIVARNNIRNTGFLEQLILFLAQHTGSLFSAKSISDFLKSQKVNIAHNQVQTYLRALTDAFLIDRIPRWDVKGKRIFETGDKFYFENTGIRNVIAGFSPADRGKILESVVNHALLFNGYDVKVGWMDKREIDFVAEKNGEKIYIQVALYLDNEKTVEREFGNLLEIRDNYPKYVISMDNAFPNTWHGIRHVPVREFLLGQSAV